MNPAHLDRELLEAGALVFDERPIVLVDVDGTLADCDGVRDPFDEYRVTEDRPHETIVRWVRNLEPEFQVVVVSARHVKCGTGTYWWARFQGVNPVHLLMRRNNDQRSDDVVKQEILNLLKRSLPGGLAQIAFVIDDRPKVIRMWRANGLRVFPARGDVEEF